jgi:DNA (cytosine-5)-methyltransferase 1
MKYLSICSGIESAGVGWHPLGYECIGLAEIDPFRSAVLQYHYPEIKNYEDFTKIQASDLSTRPDVLVGGTPCATFSIAGLRKGLAEDRGNLALEFIKLIKRVRPTWVIWENVPGILSSNGGQDLGTFLGSLGELGYGFAYRVLNTEHVRTQRFPNAIPQRRRRIFVIGHIGGDWRSPAKVLFDSAPVREDAPPSRRKREKNPEKPTYRSARSDQLVEDEVAGTIAARDYKSATDLIVDKKPWNDEDVSWSLTAHDRYTVIETSTPDKAPRIYKEEVSPTLTAMTGGNRQPIVFHESIKRNDTIRRLTPVECERLQGLPDNYTQIPYRGKPKEDCPISKRYEACGRAMSVNVMEWLGSRILKVEKGEI